jgi:hypothetical protein
VCQEKCQRHFLANAEGVCHRQITDLLAKIENFCHRQITDLLAKIENRFIL